MIDISSIIYSSENPTLASVLYTVIFSVLLGIVLAFTYEKTSRNVAKNIHFIQSLILITIVSAIILQAIGDSVARGLGMIGALSIIRFRTTVRDTRNIVFMFAAIAIGIACGVFGFTIAIIGTIGFCLTAFVLRYSKYSQKENLIGNIRLEIPRDFMNQKAIDDCISVYSKRFALYNMKIFTSEKKSNLMQYEYHIKLNEDLSIEPLVASLDGIDQVTVTSVNFKHEAIELI